MKKFLVAAFFIVGSFIFGLQDGANRWMMIKGNLPAAFNTGMDIEVNEMAIFIQVSSDTPEIIFGVFNSDITGDALSIIIGSKVDEMRLSPNEAIELYLNYPLLIQVDNNRVVEVQGMRIGALLAAYESEDAKLKEVVEQMKRGSRIRVTYKDKGKNESFVIPLNGFRTLHSRNRR